MFLKKNCIMLFVAFVMVCSLSLPASAEGLKDLPYKIIKTAELKAIWDTKPKDLLIIDTRSPEEYDDVHIPKAISIPQKKFDTYKHLLPSEKSIRLVFYCNGLK